MLPLAVLKGALNQPMVCARVSLHYLCESRRCGAPLLFSLSPLPLSASLAQLVELKNGETYNGNLVSVDQYMNLSLSDVICTSKDGAR